MTPSPNEHIEFWRIMTAEMKAGRPLTDCLAKAGAALAGTAFDRVCDLAVQRLEAGATLSRAMLEFPEIFDARIITAVVAGEEGGILDVKGEQIAAALEAGDLDRLQADAPAGDVTPEDIRARDYVKQLVLRAIESRASDIHVDATEDGLGRVRLRIDGVLYEQDRPPEGLFRHVVGRIKAMAAMDVAENRLPQDGRILLQLEGGKFDLRVSTLPVAWGERVVCRVLARQNIPLGLDHVGLGDEDLARLKHFCGLPTGVVIVNGPTGCGKTTLLYSMLMEINREANCVMTVEDPVEVTFDGLAQIQIRPSIGLTFARCIRSVLRQDPDVILVGELRDLEMMNLCAQVALTGHLVYTTLHAQTSVGAIRRLIDCGLEPFLINSTLEGVVTLRLVRMLCPTCRKAADPPPAHLLPPEAAEVIAGLADATFCEPVGCEACGGTGYRGRTAIFEVLTMDDRIRQAVDVPVDVAAIQNAARAGGMRTMLADGLAKAARGVTSAREVLRVVPLSRHA